VTIPIILVVIALVLALIDEFRAQGQSLTAWAVVALCISLLWGNVG
jgi:hypothetical protein